MKNALLIASLSVFPFCLASHGANVLHYWDMSGAGTTDSVGGVATTAGTNLDVTSSAYGAAPGSGGQYLTTTLGSWGVPMTADIHDGTNPTAMNFGTSDFSFSYWSYDDTNDGDLRGPRIFDSLLGTSTGIQLGTNLTPLYNLRIDDSDGGAFISNNTLAINQPGLQWVNITVNVSRSTGEAEIFFGGVSQGTFPVSSTGDIYPTQDMEIGSVNGGINEGGLEGAGLDDLAFYDGTLSGAEITGLANGTLTPDQIPEPGSLILLSLGAMGFLRRKR